MAAILAMILLMIMGVYFFIHFVINNGGEIKEAEGKLIESNYDTQPAKRNYPVMSMPSTYFETETIVTFLMDDGNELTLYADDASIGAYLNCRIRFTYKDNRLKTFKVLSEK